MYANVSTMPTINNIMAVVLLVHLVWPVIIPNVVGQYHYLWLTLVPPVNRQPTTTDTLNKWSTAAPFDKNIMRTEKIDIGYITDNLLESDITDYYIDTNDQTFVSVFQIFVV